MASPSPTDLTIHTKSIPLGVWVTPRAEINGYAMPLAWGENRIPAQPGVHQIHIYMPWLWRYGKADITVDNRTAPAAPVYYATPWATFVRGSIGFAPVGNPGLLAFLAVIGVPLLLVALCCVGAALLGN
jgi:hypothetical protein